MLDVLRFVIVKKNYVFKITPLNSSDFVFLLVSRMGNYNSNLLNL